MEEFLNNLYSYEYFGFYLIVSIIVLVLLFIIILFFGKKDQKVREIEATKKLQQINADAFKEEENAEKLEIKNENKLEDTIVVPNIEEVPTLNGMEEDNEIPEPIIPVQEEIKIEEQQLQEPVFEEPKLEIDEEPLLERVEEKPLAIDNTNIFNNDFLSEFVEEPQVEESINNLVEEEIEVPKFNFDEIVKEVEEVKQNESYTKGPQIFSSVYVPEKKEEVKEEKIEIPVSTEETDDIGFELPSLKKEEAKKEVIEKPILTDYNLDELSGESYTINK